MVCLTVRGVHFQPVSYFGAYPKTPTDCQRITLPEVIREIQEQTGRLLTIDQFAPSGCDHARCGFHGDFVVMPDAKLQSLPPKNTACCSNKQESNGIAMQKNRNFEARRWEIRPKQTIQHQTVAGEGMGEWENFIDRVRTHGFSVTGMAFQDCWTIDLERLRECSLHVLSPAGKVIPFCAYYLSDITGNSIYKQRGHV
ncbi:hypothetical protein E4K67_07570 [Desulfosporosinus fructosivorans]|uniref:Uncharacterized protein n=1 Tax=Desulfosporosinus fructosivorans TaxID=2018669 RepID=A0A4Z0RAD4_9FIRM|nr:hypothetical protein [Desulfosporosinus fructosivorans]TGE39289.1 hypothetical protein E4K67_07570 [Desulfosporosinus fructosivorans]